MDQRQNQLGFKDSVISYRHIHYDCGYEDGTVVFTFDSINAKNTDNQGRDFSIMCHMLWILMANSRDPPIKFLPSVIMV